MIIDGKTVITGSFNFTKAAQERNAAVTQAEPRPGFQNLLVLRDASLASKYEVNWYNHLAHSEPYSGR